MVQSDRTNQVERRDGPLHGIQHPSSNIEDKKRSPVASIGEKNKTDIRNFFQKNRPVGNLPEEEGIKAPAISEKVGLSEDCKFKRGICTTHKVAGEKRVISSKKWTKKKDGLSGWSTSKKVKWFCKASIEVAPVVQSNASEVNSESSAAPVLNNISNDGICERFQGISNISGEEGERSETSESFVEGLD